MVLFPYWGRGSGGSKGRSDTYFREYLGIFEVKVYRTLEVHTPRPSLLPRNLHHRVWTGVGPWSVVAGGRDLVLGPDGTGFAV